ncbi:MAG: ATP-binding protein [Patescibacteria group bacterium]
MFDFLKKFKKGFVSPEFSGAREEFRSLLENLEDGIITHDTNFKILSANRAAGEIFNLSLEELIGKEMSPNLIKNPHFKAIAQTIFPALAPSLDQVSRAGDWPQIINIILDEPKLELKVSVSQITDEKNKVIGFLKIIKNKTRENAILKSKSEFINVAAHQLRTPLTAVNWSLENIIKISENGDKEVNETAREALKVSERALKITNDLLDVSKVEEGRFGYSFEDADLVEFLKTSVENVAGLAKQYAIRIYFNTENGAPINVRIDPSRLGMATMNLLDNAIRYNTKNGKIIISVEKLTNQPFVKISIEDSGIGIYGDDFQKIFEKFYRGANATKAEPNGNGLGLYLTQNIIRKHGGEIGFESALNRGTTFWFTLPLDPALVPEKGKKPQENF